MSARIAPAQPPYADPVQKRLDSIMPPGLPPLLLFRTIARDQRLFSRFFGATLLDPGHLTLRERELTILRVTANNRSEYEWGVHVAIFAAQAGFSAEQLAATCQPLAHAGCWSTRDTLILQLCDAAHQSCDLSEALWQALRAELTEEALLELLMLNGLYRTVSLLTVALRMPLEPWAARFPTP